MHIRSFDGEGQDILEAFLIEPPHEEFLKFFCGFPTGSVTIWEYEIIENGVEVVAIEVSDVPEDRLIAPRPSRLVNCINNLREVVFKTLAQGYLMVAKVLDYAIQVVNIILAVILAGEMVEVAKEFRSGCCSCKLTCYQENKVDEGTAEGIKMLRRGA